MKKLTKLNLDELAATMNIVPTDEQREYIGQYRNDCYWRCLAFMREGNNSEAIAEIYAQSYLARINKNGSPSYLQQNGSGITYSDMMDLQSMIRSDGYGRPGTDPDGWCIVAFDISNISSFSGSGGHAIIIKKTYSDGSVEFYDPQNGTTGTIPASEVRYLNRVLY